MNSNLYYQEDSGGRKQKGINGVEVVDGVEPLEEHGPGGYHLLPKFQLFT